MRKSSGIGRKIFGSFLTLVLTGIIVGSVGYYSLNKVIEAREQERLGNDVEKCLFEARQQEKNLILQKDENSYQKLNQILELLATKAEEMKTVIVTQGAMGDVLKQAQVIYKNKVAELKQLFDDDARALTALQGIAARMGAVSEEQTNKVIREEKALIVEDHAAMLKQKAIKHIRDLVDVVHDALKFHHENDLPREKAFEIVRNMHFDGSNYYFIVKEDLTLIAHGSDRKLEGMDFGKIQDKKTGKTFMKEIVSEAIKNGDSYTEYYWTKPGMGDAVFPKATFAKYFKPWGLVICAGVYIDDIEQEIAKMGSFLQDGFDKLQQADAIRNLVMEARLNALYYFAFEQNAEKVGPTLAKLKGLSVATEDLREEADGYLREFTRRVKNNEDRSKSVGEIVSVAAKAQEAAKAVSKEAEAGALKTAGNGKNLMVAIVLAGALAGLLLAAFLVRAITRPLKRAIEGLSEASDHVASVAEQVSDASRHLAEGASEQAASIEETSSSLDEMSSMTRQNEGNADQANKLMIQTSEVVAKANQSMKKLTASMLETSRVSEESSKIIKTIDEIAFQTNLLALNAAVEAARAGEAGAGFSVVAEEVRNLAMRAAEAAKNTAGLIEGTVKSIRQGSEIVEETGSGFREVATNTEKMSELIGEITAASREQSQGIAQINRAIGEVGKVVDQNAANSEESASSSEEMNVQAEQMKGFVEELISIIGGNCARGRANAMIARRNELGEPASINVPASDSPG